MPPVLADAVTTYTNPVHDGYFADPFVLAVHGSFYAYATDLRAASTGRVIPILRSRDLVTWDPIGHALEPVDIPTARDYWAPEVASADGRYFIYYSAGVEDRHHRIRVASAASPVGPFRDHGHELVPDEPFTIDAHPFRDVDGRWYLYYARDFLDGDRVGTGIVVDRLVDMDRLAGTPTTVLRASADWQLFRRRREMYGAVYDWHTLEGPFVLRRNGRYWCLYSGGAWAEAGYGISVAVADSPLGPFVEDASGGPVILRSDPGRVLGPGHCSVVTAPDGTDYIVYHAWDAARTARRMYIDRLEWTPDGPRCDGPSSTARPAPVMEAPGTLGADH
jgi:beta-xylosidase